MTKRGKPRRENRYGRATLLRKARVALVKARLEGHGPESYIVQFLNKRIATFTKPRKAKK